MVKVNFNESLITRMTVKLFVCRASAEPGTFLHLWVPQLRNWEEKEHPSLEVPSRQVFVQNYPQCGMEPAVFRMWDDRCSLANGFFNTESHSIPVSEAMSQGPFGL